jgi:hypothetical protein
VDSIVHPYFEPGRTIFFDSKGLLKSDTAL